MLEIEGVRATLALADRELESELILPLRPWDPPELGRRDLSSWEPDRCLCLAELSAGFRWECSCCFREGLPPLLPPP